MDFFNDFDSTIPTMIACNVHASECFLEPVHSTISDYGRFFTMKDFLQYFDAVSGIPPWQRGFLVVWQGSMNLAKEQLSKDHVAVATGSGDMITQSGYPPSALPKVGQVRRAIIGLEKQKAQTGQPMAGPDRTQDLDRQIRDKWAELKQLPYVACTVSARMIIVEGAAGPCTVYALKNPGNLNEREGPLRRW